MSRRGDLAKLPPKRGGLHRYSPEVYPANRSLSRSNSFDSPSLQSNTSGGLASGSPRLQSLNSSSGSVPFIRLQHDPPQGMFKGLGKKTENANDGPTLLEPKLGIDVPRSTWSSRVKVEVIAAKSLMAADNFFGGGKSDPYCIGTWSDDPKTELFKTATISNTLEPTWNHVCEINWVDPSKSLVVNVYDYDKDKPNDPDFLGTLTLPASEVLKPTNEGGWYLLTPGSSGNTKISTSKSKIQIKFTAMPPPPNTPSTKPPPSPNPPSQPVTAANPSLNSSAGALPNPLGGLEDDNIPETAFRLTIISASNLPKMDGLLGGGASDPYVEVYEGEKQLWKTAHVANTTNPVWKDTYKDLSVTSSKLELRIMEYDKGKPEGRPVGCVILDLTQFAKTGQPMTGAFKIELDKKVKTSGTPAELNLRLEKPPPPTPAPTPAPTPSTAPTVVTKPAPTSTQASGQMPSNSNPPAASSTTIEQTTIDLRSAVLKIHVIGASDLMAMDSTFQGGKSDPYCEVYVDADKVYVTKSITNNLNPRWDEVVETPAMHENATVRFVLYDKDAMGSNDYLGEAEILISALKDGKELSKRLTLGTKRKEKVTSGSIDIRIQAIPADQATFTGAPEKKSKAGRLHILIAQAQGLLSADDNGLSDPFVVALFGKVEVKTPVVKESLSPIWNFHHTFVDVENLDGNILFTVFDWDGLSRNDFLGQVLVPLQNLQESKAVAQWHPLLPGKSGIEVTGSILIKMLYTNLEMPKQQFIALTTAAQPVDEARTGGVLRVDIIKAVDLKGADGQTSDPYVELNLDKQKFKTTQISKTINPIWSQQHIFDIGPLSTELHVKVVDHNMIMRNTLLGEAKVALAKYKDELYHEELIELTGNGKHIGGKILLGFLYASSQQKLLEMKVSNVKLKPSKGARVFCQVLEALDLSEADNGGTTDPYVVVQYHNQEFKTKHMPKTLHPVWDENMQENCHVFLDVMNKTDNFRVAVYDYDEWSPNDFLGELLVPVSSIIAEPPNHYVTKWCKLLPGKSKKEVTGEVLLRFCYSEAPKSDDSFFQEAKVLPRPQRIEQTGGGLLVEVIQGKEIKAMDKSGMSDPFVVLKYGKQEFTTQPVKKSVNPVWNQQYLFDDTKFVEGLHVELYDWNMLLPKKLIGKALIPKAKFEKLPPVVEWFSMQSEQSSEQVGKIYMRLHHSIENFKSLVDQRKFKPSNGGRLFIQIVSARDLFADDDNGRSDPYAIFKFEGQEYKTITSKNGGLNPEWEESQHHIFVDVVDFSKNLHVNMYDYDKWSFNDPLGECIIPLSTLEAEVAVNKWFKLLPGRSKKPITGEVQLILLLSLMEKSEEDFLVAARSTPKPLEGPKSGGRLLVDVVQALDLPAMNKDGTTDPYCTFKLGKQTWKTSHLDKTRKPVWNQQYLFDVTAISTELAVEVFDHEFLKDQVIGGFTVPIKDLIAAPDVVRDEWYPITLGPGQPPRGKLHLRLQYSLNNVSELVKKAAVKRSKGGRIHLQVMEARELKSDDGGGTSDPFCEVKVAGQEWKTEIVQKSLNPIWKNQRHTFLDITDLEENILLQVYDYDTLRNDFLGEVLIPVSELVDEVCRDKWFKLMPGKSKEEITGEIRVRMQYTLREVSDAEFVSLFSKLKGETRQGSTGGVLLVDVIRAKSLQGVESDGKSDPFVHLTYGQQKFKTAPVKGNVNPVWNQQKLFDHTKFCQGLLVEVFDHNVVLKNRLIGKVLVPFSEFQAGTPLEKWFPIESVDSKATQNLGEIYLKLHYTAEDISQLQTSKTASKGANIFIQVMEATDLVALDGDGENSDPYVVAKLKDEEYKTIRKDKTLNPRWERQCHIFRNVSNLNDNLIIQVYDHDVAFSDFMGMVMIPLSSIEDMKPVDKWYTLLPGKDSKPVSGEIRIRAALSFNHKKTESEYISDCDAIPNPKPAVSPAGQLIVSVVRATDLLKADKYGSSDPYIVLKVGAQKFKTTKVKSSLAPVWNQQHVFDLTKTATALDITLYDGDVLGSDELIGSASISRADLQNMQPFDGWIELHTDGPAGKLHLKYQIVKTKEAFQQAIGMIQSTKPPDMAADLQPSPSVQRQEQTIVKGPEVKPIAVPEVKAEVKSVAVPTTRVEANPKPQVGEPSDDIPAVGKKREMSIVQPPIPQGPSPQELKLESEAAESRRKIAELQSTIEKLETEKEEMHFHLQQSDQLKSENSSLKACLDDIQKELVTTKKRVQDLVEDSTNIRANYGSSEQKMSALEIELVKKTVAISTLEQQFNEARSLARNMQEATKRQVQELETELARYRKENAMLNANEVKMRDDILRMDQKIAQLEKEIYEKNHELVPLKAEKERIEQELHWYRNVLEDERRRSNYLDRQLATTTGELQAKSSEVILLKSDLKNTIGNLTMSQEAVGRIAEELDIERSKNRRLEDDLQYAMRAVSLRDQESEERGTTAQVYAQKVKRLEADLDLQRKDYENAVNELRKVKLDLDITRDSNQVGKLQRTKNSFPDEFP
eukprot:TRINITY_DN7156_c0_g1_i4.p1 TRINITY_DN7156_c0_g1~~TRINITY_DN7156_c0_g1_i4.p1  ORF type:complete len:2498 (+),score=509.79 TRINITY_DN7156_c0_g1_i4:61-7554(+)